MFIITDYFSADATKQALQTSKRIGFLEESGLNGSAFSSPDKNLGCFTSTAVMSTFGAMSSSNTFLMFIICSIGWTTSGVVPDKQILHTF